MYKSFLLRETRIHSNIDSGGSQAANSQTETCRCSWSKDYFFLPLVEHSNYFYFFTPPSVVGAREKRGSNPDVKILLNTFLFYSIFSTENQIFPKLLTKYKFNISVFFSTVLIKPSVLSTCFLGSYIFHWLSQLFRNQPDWGQKRSILKKESPQEVSINRNGYHINMRWECLYLPLT